MSFRIKVLFWNMILISLAFGISGYLLINRSHSISLEREIERITSENQLIQAGLSAELTNRILQGSFLGVQEEWQSIGEGIMESLQGTNAWFCIMDESGVLYQDQGQSYEPDRELTDGLTEGRKQYVIYRDGDSRYIASAGQFQLSTHPYYVINRRDISVVYQERDLQLQYFRYLMIAVLSVCGIVMSVISGILTAPIRKLKRTTGRIADGNYQTRARIHSKDEIGDLARDFNRMAKAVEDNIHELEEENRRKEEFVANFTHELKTPLTSVIGYAEMLSSQNLTKEEQDRAANYIFHEGVRLEDMSMKLFEMFLLGREELTCSTIYVPDFLDSVADSAEPIVEKDQMHLSVRSEECCISGDGVLLKTVFINMIDNARKASAPGSTIYLQARAVNSVVYIEVKDNGCGIPEEDIHKITEAFYMVDKSRSREKGGAGLGLALAAKILQKHGAKLSVKSAVGQGTVMCTAFPEIIPEEEEWV